MEKSQFIKEVNEDTIQKYITHPSLRDVVFCAFNATPEEGQTKLNGVWINISGADAYPCGYDVIDIKDEDVDKWTFIASPKGKLSA